MKKLLLLILLTGCSQSVVTLKPVEITGIVTLKGKPIPNAILHLQPTDSGTQADLQVKNGQVRGTVTPGTYAYYLEGKTIPDKYRTGSLDSLVEITQGTTLNLSL